MKSPQTIEQQLCQVLYDAWKAVNKDVVLRPEGIQLEHPAEGSHGDYASNIAMAILARSKKQEARSEGKNKGKISLGRFENPRKLAEAIVQELNSLVIGHQSSVIEKAEVAGPGFINIWIKNDWLVKEAARVINEGSDFGKTPWHKGESWLIEHTSPNPNKAMHLGHLRNNVTGMAIANIWEFQGINVIRDCIDNDRGIAVARLMWGYLKSAHKQGKGITDLSYWYDHQDEWLTPEEAKKRPDRFVDELYVKASQDFKSDPAVEKRVRQLVVDWEAGDKKTWALWERVLRYSHEGQKLTLDRLGSKWDKVWHEHEHYQQGKDLVDQGLEKGIFRRLDNGAILSDLKKYKLPDTILIKADGTSLYITQDLALTKLKKETFHPDRTFWVIGPEQSLALKQLFAICEQLGIGKMDEFTHIAFGYMSIKGQGKMSSRTGNVVYINELIDKVKESIFTKIDKERFGKKELATIAEEVALGAVKYSILKVRRLLNMAFDFDESISLEGDSGPYLQYTFARTQSVLAKASSDQLPATRKNWRLAAGDWQLNAEELSILRWLYRYPEVVKQAGRDYAPNVIANYLYELARRYNVFYNKHRILNPASSHQLPATSKEKSNDSSFRIHHSEFRILLTAATGQVIKNGLTLLGIPTPGTM